MRKRGIIWLWQKKCWRRRKKMEAGEKMTKRNKIRTIKTRIKKTIREKKIRIKKTVKIRKIRAEIQKTTPNKNLRNRMIKAILRIKKKKKEIRKRNNNLNHNRVNSQPNKLKICWKP